MTERCDSELDLRPLGEVSAVTELGEGRYGADLHPEWAVGDKPHGGYLLAVLTRAALATVGPQSPDPLAVSAQYLRPPSAAPALVRTELRKAGRTVSAVAAELEQNGRTRVAASVTTGTLPDGDPDYADVPDGPAEPPADAVVAGEMPGAPGFTRACDMRLDVATAGFLRGRTDLPPRLRMWVRPLGEPTDVLFALVAGDLSMPVTMNQGRFGWAPTVQLTALLRARPAPGWLRLEVRALSVHGGWFDSDALVIDSRGRLVCQARQLAIAP